MQVDVDETCLNGTFVTLPIKAKLILTLSVRFLPEYSVPIEASLHHYHKSWQLDEVEIQVYLLYNALGGDANLHSASQPVPDRLWLLFQVSQALEDRYAYLGQLSDAEEHVHVCEEALALAPEGYLEHGDTLLALGSALRMRFDQSAALADIERAVELHTTVDTMTDINLRREEVACELGQPHFQLFLHNSALGDFAKAVSRLREACGCCPPDNITLAIP